MIPLPYRPGNIHDRSTVGFRLLAVACVMAITACAGTAPAPPSATRADGPGVAPDRGADLIVWADRVWTGDPERPWAEAVAIRGERIIAVGSRAELTAHAGADTRWIEQPGGFVAPGFIDNHTHFRSAGSLLLGANLLDVADTEGMRRRVAEARERLPAGAWIVGGDWGAYEAWGQGSTGRGPGEAAPAFDPDRSVIDPVTRGTPAILSKWDGSAFLANEAALRAVGAECGWEGVECVDGRPTGRLAPAAARRVMAAIPPRSMEQRLAEGRVALEQLRSFGVTTIHDNTPPDQLEVFERLRSAGELTTRIYARPTLDRWEELSERGLRHGSGDDWIRIGGLKGFVDGIMGNSSARFYEPYLTTGERGSWRTMMTEPPGMLRLLIGADAAGHWPQVHAIGDEAIDTLLDMFDRMVEVNGPRDRRLRVIHTQVIRGPEVARRMARAGIIAEVQPYHAIDDMRWMEERIGERARWAYAFRTLHDAGVMLSFGSDWPGTNASWYPANPLEGIYAAVTRQTLDGQPPGGWFPEERIDVETALRAYTVNNAWAEGQEASKGTLAPGMLADLVVLDRDPFRIPGADIRHIGVRYTITGGRVVHEPGAGAGAAPER